jgi:pimeloyl-ACP methyl ester carboxylesterase
MSFWSTLGALSERHCFIFVQTRGLWGAALPATVEGMSVEAHARDLAAVVDALGERKFGILGHCSGVAVLLASLRHLRIPPERLAMVSARFASGNSLNVAGLMAHARSSPSLRRNIARIAVEYAPEPLHAGLEQELSDLERLHAHLYSIHSSRVFSYDVDLPPQTRSVIAVAEQDDGEIRSSSLAYARTRGTACTRLLELPGGHFFFQQDLGAATQVMRAAFPSD